MTVTELLETVRRVELRTNRLVNDAMVGAYLSHIKGCGMDCAPFASGVKENALLNWMPFGNSHAESQRDSGSKLRVARNEPPWENTPQTDNPNGVAARHRQHDTTPLGLKIFARPTQGSSFLATLGWQTQSRWDCHRADVAVNSASRDFNPLDFERVGNCGKFAIIKIHPSKPTSFFNPIEFDGIRKAGSAVLKSEGLAWRERNLA
jgi:hypothetical protein